MGVLEQYHLQLLGEEVDRVLEQPAAKKRLRTPSPPRGFQPPPQKPRRLLMPPPLHLEVKTEQKEEEDFFIDVEPKNEVPLTGATVALVMGEEAAAMLERVPKQPSCPPPDPRKRARRAGGFATDPRMRAQESNGIPPNPKMDRRIDEDKRERVFCEQSELLEKERVFREQQSELLEKERVFREQQAELLEKECVFREQAELREQQRIWIMKQQADELERQRLLLMQQAALQQQQDFLRKQQLDIVQQQLEEQARQLQTQSVAASGAASSPSSSYARSRQQIQCSCGRNGQLAAAKCAVVGCNLCCQEAGTFDTCEAHQKSNLLKKVLSRSERGSSSGWWGTRPMRRGW